MPRPTQLQPARWALPIVIALTLLIAQLGGDAARLLLRYDRARIFDGEAWRLVSGHLVHADAAHLGWNLAGLALVWALFAGEFNTAGWVAVALASTIAIDLGFLLLEPGLDWYVGFSGVLHGLMAAGLAAWLRVRRDPVTVVVTAGFVAKLIWEHLRGPLPLTAETLSVPIVHEAHSYGTLGGLACAVWLLVRAGVPRSGPSL